MKSKLLPAAGLMAALVLALSGCMHNPSHGHHGATPNSAAPAAQGAMSHGSKMDRATMCERYGSMTPEQRRSMMEAHHPDMSPEMMEQREQKMRERCAGQN